MKYILPNGDSIDVMDDGRVISTLLTWSVVFAAMTDDQSLPIDFGSTQHVLPPSLNNS